MNTGEFNVFRDCICDKISFAGNGINFNLFRLLYKIRNYNRMLLGDISC